MLYIKLDFGRQYVIIPREGGMGILPHVLLQLLKAAKGVFVMNAIAKKVFILAAFSLVLICIFHMDQAFAASKSSSKIACKRSSNVSYKRKYKVASRSMVSSANKVDSNSIIRYAKNYLGTRYVYGGSGPGAFDCSGFTRYVMGRFGIDLPHCSYDQFSYGVIVSMEGLKQGDLIYFATSGGNMISHVGIYIGDGYFIHASLQGVEISSLGSSYYSSRYVAATRLIT
ncbi:MAG TPA: hypothetical protein DD429_09185 [Clostridiaceae bacterium]|nr:hypothetical protein [Clostridiaceae bacterium]